MNTYEFHTMLQPARKRLDRLRFMATVVKTVNCLLIVLLSLSLAAMLYNITAAALTTLQLFTIMLSAICIHGIWLGWKFFDKSEYVGVVQKIDNISNQHNMISTALEFVQSGRDSEFAEHTILKGTGMLESASLDKLKVPCPPIRTAMLTAACLAMIVSFMMIHEGAADFESPNQIDQLKKEFSLSKSALLPAYIERTLDKKTDKSSSQISSVGFQKPEEHSDTNATEQASTEMSQSAETAFKKTGRLRQNNKVNASQNNKTDNNSSKVTMSRSGTAATPPVETAVQVDFLNINAGLDEDQLNAKIKEKDANKNLSDNSHRPFADDRRPAPGRELGRSGKKGKPGNGRGGLGSVKKSRSTAALFPGQMMTVHVPGKPGKGKSKSFESGSPLRTAEDAVETSLANTQSREGQVDIYPVKDSLVTITKLYFEEMNAYANRMFRESPKEN